MNIKILNKILILSSALVIPAMAMEPAVDPARVHAPAAELTRGEFLRRDQARVKLEAEAMAEFINSIERSPEELELAKELYVQVMRGIHKERYDDIRILVEQKEAAAIRDAETRKQMQMQLKSKI